MVMALSTPPTPISGKPSAERQYELEFTAYLQRVSPAAAPMPDVSATAGQGAGLVEGDDVPSPAPA